MVVSLIWHATLCIDWVSKFNHIIGCTNVLTNFNMSQVLGAPLEHTVRQLYFQDVASKNNII